MDLKNEFEKIMAEATTMALATSVEDIPNVRILNLYILQMKKYFIFNQKLVTKKKKNL